LYKKTRKSLIVKCYYDYLWRKKYEKDYERRLSPHGDAAIRDCCRHRGSRTYLADESVSETGYELRACESW